MCGSCALTLGHEGSHQNFDGCCTKATIKKLTTTFLCKVPICTEYLLKTLFALHNFTKKTLRALQNLTKNIIAMKWYQQNNYLQYSHRSKQTVFSNLSFDENKLKHCVGVAAKHRCENACSSREPLVVSWSQDHAQCVSPTSDPQSVLLRITFADDLGDAYDLRLSREVMLALQYLLLRFGKTRR